MLDFTFLTYEQCFVESKKLDVLKKYGVKAEATDFANFLFGNKSIEDNSYYLSTCNDKEFAYVSSDGNFIASTFFYEQFMKICKERYKLKYDNYSMCLFSRPVLLYSKICSFSNKLKKGKLKNGVTWIEFV